MNLRLIYLLGAPILLNGLSFSKYGLYNFGKRAKHICIQPRISFRTKDSVLLRETRLYSSSKNDIPKPKALAPKYKPRTENQRIYNNHLNDQNVSIVLGIGPAGCGKTLFACLTALDQLKRGNIEKIVLTRPIVPVENEEIGFLPGNLVNKMDPWTRPIFDIILEQYHQHELTQMLKNNIIEISPLAFMRGRTFKNAFIIADEMQNSSPNQMLMLTTRLGTNSKLVVTGDLKQSDRTIQNVDNGLRDLMYKLRQNQNLTDIKMVEMQYDDVERSPIVKTMLNLYSNKNRDSSVSEVDSRFSNNIKSTDSKTKKPDNDAALIPRDQYKDNIL